MFIVWRLRFNFEQYTVQDTSLDITFDLLPVPRMHSRVDSPREELDLDNATQLLMAAVKNNKMVFELQGGCSMVSQRIYFVVVVIPTSL